MNKQVNSSQKFLHKQKLRDKKLKDLTIKLKSNIAKRKLSKLKNKNG